ncbi:integrase, partial [Vibrio cholerae]|nr:integrase [Vibrio cholerae]
MTFNNHLKASNSQEVTKRSHYASLSQSVCFPSSNPSNSINPHYRNIPKIYFTTIKKQNTFYLRVSAQNESVTVSLRTNNRREAMMNTDYLKERLLEKAGSFV